MNSLIGPEVKTAEFDSAKGAMSPFLPGTRIQFAWDSTSLGWLKTCPRLYYYSMIEGYRLRGSNVHLLFGGWYHSALEAYDRIKSAGGSHQDALREVVAWLMKETWIRPESAVEGEQAVAVGKPWESNHNLKTRETLVRSVIWYIDQFGETDTCHTVQLANGKPAVELSFRLEMPWGPKAYGVGSQPYVLSGHLDRVVEFQGNFYVMDRKTSSTTIGSYYFDQYDPDNQMSLYSMAARVIYKTPVRGVIIDAAQIAVGFSRFTRGFTFRTEAQIEEWLDETKAWLRMAEQFAEANHWPMNDKSCHQYGGCAFRGVCSKSPEVRQKFLESGFEKRQWNPLEPR